MRLVFLAILGALFLASCGGGSGATPTSDEFSLFPDETPTALTAAGVGTPASGPTSTPVAQTLTEARNLVWAHLSKCVSLEPGQLEAYLIKGDWFVQASTGSLPDYGLWKVDVVTGNLETGDLRANDLKTFVDDGCSPQERRVLFPPTPSPTASPLPTSTPTPTATLGPPPTPVVRSADEARNAVWQYLRRCFMLHPDELESVPIAEGWIVEAPRGAPKDYGAWKVDAATGTRLPHDTLARDLQSFLDSDCSEEVFAELFPPTPTPSPIPPSPTLTPPPPTPTPPPPTPSPTPTPPLPTPVPTPTPVPPAVQNVDQARASYGNT